MDTGLRHRGGASQPITPALVFLPVRVPTALWDKPDTTCQGVPLNMVQWPVRVLRARHRPVYSIIASYGAGRTS
eukprot:11661636-Karenia_brevis.AAC.1